MTYVYRKKNSGLQLYSLGTSCEVSKRKIQKLLRFAKFCECSNEVLKHFEMDSDILWTLPRTTRISGLKSQNSQQKSVPDLYVVTVAFLALKESGFFTFSDPPKKFQNFFYKIIM